MLKERRERVRKESPWVQGRERSGEKLQVHRFDCVGGRSVAEGGGREEGDG